MFDDRFRGEWDFRESNLMENNSSLGFLWERWVVFFVGLQEILREVFVLGFFAIKTIASFG